MPPPRLQPPGAGLPWWELLVVRHLVFPRVCRKLDWARAGRLFQREGEQVLTLFDALPADRRTERVLIPRLGGMEDSSRHWSAAMTVEHLNIVGTGMLGIIARLRAGEVPPGRVGTADVKPRGEEPPAKTREKFIRLLADAAAADNTLPLIPPGAGPRYAHPWFGPIDAHQWHCLLGVHQGIHRRQLENIRDGLTR